MGIPPWLLEPMIGHAGKGVTGMFYDRPSGDMFASAVAEAYAKNPFDEGWDWVG